MKQEVTAQQHHLLKQLFAAGGEAPLSRLKPAPKAAMLSPLEKRQWVAKRKEKRSTILVLTDAGREWISQHSEFAEEKPLYTVAQRLFLMDLMLTGGSAASADVSSPLDAKGRKLLIGARLLEETKGPNRTVSFSLADAGWKWAEEHLTDSYKTPGAAAKVLQKSLSRLHEHLIHRELRLADFARPRKGADGGGGRKGDGGTGILPVLAPRRRTDGGEESKGESAAQSNPDVDLPSPPLPDIARAIESACLQLGGGANRQPLRLAEVRRLLARFDHRAQDTALLELAMAGGLVLYRMDDPKEIQEEDRAAELRTPGGEPRHIVYWIGAKS